MAGKEIYQDITFLGFYFFSLWFAGWLCRKIKLTPIVGQILIGILFGPQGISFVPLFDGFSQITKITDYFLETNITFPLEDYDTLFPDKTEFNNFLIVLGNIGVTFLIFESGMHVDFSLIEKVGGSALLVALFGTFFSYLLGIIFAVSFGFDIYPDGVAIGAVIAPTSVGIALKILSDNGQLVSTFGQTIITAAFTDDIFSLISLSLLVQIAGGDITATSIIKPISLTIAIIIVSILLATKVFPFLIPFLLKNFKKNSDKIHFCFLLGLLTIFGYIGTFVGSHLLGSFFAGVSFCKVPRSAQVWTHMTESLTAGLLALFFGATVAFQIPVDQLTDINNFWKGLLLSIGCIIVKVFSGLHLTHRWEVGWAMVSRGEFSFLVGETLETTEYLDSGKPFLSEEAFGIAIWALLIVIFIAPASFEFVLQKNKGVDQGVSNIESSHYIENEKPVITKISTANVIRSFIKRPKRETTSSKYLVQILLEEEQTSLLLDTVEVFKTLKIKIGRFEETTVGIEFEIELEEPTSPVVDEYFYGDIEKRISRIKRHIHKLLIVEAEIIIERITLPTIKRVRKTSQI